MVTIQQIQGRKARLFSYSYKRAIPVEAETVEQNEIATGVKITDRTNLSYEQFKVYGGNWVGCFIRASQVKKIRVKARRVGSPAPLRVRLLDGNDMSLKEEKEVTGVGATFSTVETVFSTYYNSATLPDGTFAGFYIFFFQLGNAGDPSNYYEILPCVYKSNMSYVVSNDGGQSFVFNSGASFTLTNTGTYAYFNGTGYGIIPDAASLHFSDFTLELEFRTTWTGNAPQDMFLIDKGYDDKRDWWVRIASGTRTAYAGYGDGANGTEASFTLPGDTDPHFLQVTFNNTTKTLTVYLDGSQVAQATGTNPISNSTNPITFASKVDQSAKFTGMITLFRGYDAVLSSSELAQSRYKRQGPPTANLKVWVQTNALKGGMWNFGRTTPGGTLETFTTRRAYYVKFTATGSGWVSTIYMQVNANNYFTVYGAAIYADSNGYPGARLAVGTSWSYYYDGTNWWVKIIIPETFLFKGTTYWLACDITAIVSNRGVYYVAGSANQTYIDGDGDLTDPAPSGMTGYAREYVIYTPCPMDVTLKDLSNNGNAGMFNALYMSPGAPLISVFNDADQIVSDLMYNCMIYGNISTRMYFTVYQACRLTAFGIRIGKTGSIPVNLQVDVRRKSDDSLLGTTYIDLSKVMQETVYSGVFSTPPSLAANIEYYAELKLVINAGNEENYVYFRYSPQLVSSGDNYNGLNMCYYAIIFAAGLTSTALINQTSVGTNQTIYGNTRVGQTFILSKRAALDKIQFYISKTGSPQNLILDIYAVDPNTLKPTGPALATLETPAANIGTSLAWTDFNISYAFTKDTFFAAVLYQKGNGGDASNYYTVQYATSNPIQGNMVTSSDAGATWSVSSSNDLGIKVYVFDEALVWQKTFDLSEYSVSIAATTVLVKTRLRSLDGKYVALRVLVNDIEYDDVGAAYNGVLYLTQTVVPDSKTYTEPSITVKIYGAGNGLINMITYERCFYFNAQRITPADFNVSEMILYDGALEPGTVIMFDDNPLQTIVNPDDAPDVLYFDLSEAPREVLVRSLTVAKGRADISFLGW